MNTEQERAGEAGECRLIVNGEVRRLAAVSLGRALIELGYGPDGKGIAVALNGRIVHRSQWHSATLGNDDVLDIVGAVQGG